jgi:hypothetical protein
METSPQNTWDALPVSQITPHTGGFVMTTGAQCQYNTLPYNYPNPTPDPYWAAPSANTYTAAPPGLEEYLSGHLGNILRAEFEMNGQLVERVGILTDVGPNYLVLEALDHTTLMLCDLNRLRFATILPTAAW